MVPNIRYLAEYSVIAEYSANSLILGILLNIRYVAEYSVKAEYSANSLILCIRPNIRFQPNIRYFELA